MDEDDELMAVLLGEPARGKDGAAAERHAAAERDMAVVREQLRWIGDGLVRSAAAPRRPEPRDRRERQPGQGPQDRQPEQEQQEQQEQQPEQQEQGQEQPERSGRSRRRRRLGALVLAASVAVALLGTGAAYLVAHNGSLDGGGDALLTEEGLIACSRDIAEGTVADVRRLGGGDRFRIVLDVERSYRPAEKKERLVFTDEGPGVPDYYTTGARMLVLVSGESGEPPQTYRAGDPWTEGGSGTGRDALDQGRRTVERSLAGARDLTCSGTG
ncbi:hypothetical protein [Streptomyces sp. NPDC093094]|uniref:hypothetical protein n=1 Tax=Streptomyces sp. NPDC093094 TaxID=3366026 RepID=UPI0038309760